MFWYQWLNSMYFYLPTITNVMYMQYLQEVILAPIQKLWDYASIPPFSYFTKLDLGL
jgi:hypothetical protein